MLGHTLSNWPESDKRKLVLAYNKAHGGAGFFNAIASHNARIHTAEIPVWDHMCALSRLEESAILKRYSIKLLNRFIRPFLVMQAVLYFRKLCLDKEVVAIFSHSGGYPEGLMNQAAIMGGRLAKVKRICLVVHSLAKRPRRLTLALAWLHDTILCKSINDLVAVSEACADALRANRFISKDIQVIYNGIPVLPPTPFSGQKESSGRFTVAYVGELAAQKGVAVLLRAIASIHEPMVLFLYGKGEGGYERELHKLAELLGIGNKVMFMGFDPDVATKLSGIDVLVLPSIAYESFGMVLLEAMRHRKPAIVTDVGGMKEVVVDRETGFVVPSNAPESLSSALLKLIRNAELATLFGENGYRRLCKKFSVERMVADYFLLTQ